MNERRNVPEIVIVNCKLLRRSQTRINLLFTMSEIPHARPVGHDMRSDVSRTTIWHSVVSPSSLFRASPGTLRSPCPAAPRIAEAKRGGARRDRTDDLMLAKHALSQLSYGPVPEDECFKLDEKRMHSIKVVGLGRLELPTSRLSSARSNQLSYKPLTLFLEIRIGNLLARIDASAGCIAQAQAPGACSSAKKEKRRRRNPANGAQRSGDRWPLMFLKRSDRTA